MQFDHRRMTPRLIWPCQIAHQRLATRPRKGQMIRPVCRYLHHVPGKPRSFFRAGGSGQEKRRGQEHKCRDAPHCWLSQLTDDAVAGRIEDAAPVSFDQLIDDGAASL